MDKVKEAVARAELQGWSSLLIYSDHTQLDPWIVANIMISMTKRLAPLVALQPLYMHPFTAAKLIASMSLLYDRPVNINFISGAFPRDLETFCDTCSHDDRYSRVVEYGTILMHMLCEKRPLTFKGRFYSVDSLQAPWPPLKSDCIPMLTISGSSEAGLSSARQLGARAIQYLRPFTEYSGVTLSPNLQYGTRVGIISRDTSETAWEAARKRYPSDSAGAEIREYSTSVSDSVWVRELARNISVPPEHPYWLGPYRNNQAACPFLVGDWNDVASELAGYIGMGLRTFLIESPADDEDAAHITNAFAVAQKRALAASCPKTNALA
jgi:alkanesulfonate monooxygenase